MAPPPGGKLVIGGGKASTKQIRIGRKRGKFSPVAQVHHAVIFLHDDHVFLFHQGTGLKILPPNLPGTDKYNSSLPDQTGLFSNKSAANTCSWVELFNGFENVLAVLDIPKLNWLFADFGMKLPLNYKLLNPVQLESCTIPVGEDLVKNITESSTGFVADLAVVMSGPFIPVYGATGLSGALSPDNNNLDFFTFFPSRQH